MIIGMSSWILQDGNYKDFAKGDLRDFALEYAPKAKLTKSNSQTKEFKSLGEGLYQVNAEVVYCESKTSPCTHVSMKNGKRVEEKSTYEETIVVLDLGSGIMVFDEPVDMKPYKKGGFIQGEIWIGIDPFFYKEGHCKRPGIPALIYPWKIEKIEMLTAPLILDHVDKRGTKVFQRDKTKIAYKEIDKTSVWEDDDCHAEYLLTCTKQT